MAHIVSLGAGIGGMPMAYDLRTRARKEDKITVISNVDYFQFVPSNPWVAVNWRKRDDIAFPIAPYLAKKNIDFIPVAILGQTGEILVIVTFTYMQSSMGQLDDRIPAARLGQCGGHCPGSWRVAGAVRH